MHNGVCRAIAVEVRRAASYAAPGCHSCDAARLGLRVRAFVGIRYYLHGRSGGRWVCVGGFVGGVEGGLRLVEHLAILAFPDSEEEKGQRGGGGPEFGAAWNFYFGLPAKELGGDEEAESCPDGKRYQLNQNSLHRKGREHGILQSANQIRRGQEHRNVLR